MKDYDSFRIYDFTGFEKEFEFSMKVDGKWQDFTCAADFHVVYDTPEDNFNMILYKAKVTMYDATKEDYVNYSLNKDEFETLQAWMHDSTHWDEYYEYMNYND
jgi:hypothetical protein